MNQIVYSKNGYWVSNGPVYHVWIPGVTHSTLDSAYTDLTLAIARCDYLAKTARQTTIK